MDSADALWHEYKAGGYADRAVVRRYRRVENAVTRYWVMMRERADIATVLRLTIRRGIRI